MNPVTLRNIENITISGRIASGTTTLATGLTKELGWELLEGGEIFLKVHKDLDLSEVSSDKRPDSFDLEYEEKVKEMLKNGTHQIIQSHLAGFDAQGIDGVYKILVVTEDSEGNDMQDIRIDRLVNRRQIHVDEAKEEVRVREQNNIGKWKRLYAKNDPNWVYWDRKYYDLVVNTFSHNKEESLAYVLENIGYKPQSSQI